ncbi:glycerophosphodiester phosphodiesterase [Gracilibacillus halotolerans]|uniref:glycerophosphodiester phosphodiesterase n=1 Tax=Gracilibacillus halotolerans TaxID=74386 RepID=UPI0031B5DFC4
MIYLKTLIYAHRGASKYAPENTMPAFNLAYEQKADGIETDVQLTKDNVPVLIHDEMVNRTTNGKGFVHDYTYEQLRELDAGLSFHYRFIGTRIPTLDDLLKWNQKKRLRLNIELKNSKLSSNSLEEIVIKKIKAFNMENLCIISTFSMNSIKNLCELNSPIPYAFLTSKNIPGFIEKSKELRASGIHIRYRLLNRRLFRSAKNNNLYIAVYTLNHPVTLTRAFQFPCDAVITDVPDIAVRYRNRVQQED